MRYLAGAFLGAILMVAPTVAFAQDAEPTPAQIRAAAEAFDSGRTAYKEEQYQAAAEQFERADANAPSPAALEFALRARDKEGNPGPVKKMILRRADRPVKPAAAAPQPTKSPTPSRRRP